MHLYFKMWFYLQYSAFRQFDAFNIFNFWIDIKESGWYSIIEY